jgi:hypothetical protein
VHHEISNSIYHDQAGPGKARVGGIRAKSVHIQVDLLELCLCEAFSLFQPPVNLFGDDPPAFSWVSFLLTLNESILRAKLHSVTCNNGLTPPGFIKWNLGIYLSIKNPIKEHIVLRT